MNFKSQSVLNCRKYLITSFLVFILYIIAVTLITFVCWKFDVRINNVKICYYIACVVGTSLNSFGFAALSSSKGWLKGTIGGVVFLILIYLFGYLICMGEVDSISFLCKVPLFILLSLSCGIFGINFRS